MPRYVERIAPTRRRTISGWSTRRPVRASLNVGVRLSDSPISSAAFAGFANWRFSFAT
jgi:hypothetical protein